MIRGLLMAEGVSPVVIEAAMPLVAIAEDKAVKVVKRKASKYARKYGRAFRQVASRYKTKSGSWKKNGFRNAQKAAHKLAKGMK
jgi:hypothetical protein